MTSKELAKIAVKALDDKKGEDITVIDISEVSVVADYSRNGGNLKQIEGYDAGNWVLLDFQDVIVHIFDRDNRLFYDSERIWRDGKLIAAEEL